MIEDIAPLRETTHSFKVVAVDLMETNGCRDVVEFATDQIVNSNNRVIIRQHGVSEMTAQKSGNTSDKDPHIDLRASCNSIPTSRPAWSNMLSEAERQFT
jgi:hypothetical protein